MINFIYLTLFPQYFHNYFQISLAKKIGERKLLTYQVYNLRDFAVREQVDDYPYGGGGGMVLKIEPLVRALAVIQESYPNSYLILLSPQGKTFTQAEVPRLLNQASNLVFICGRYEGFDQRVLDSFPWRRMSIGEFVLSGGEVPAMVLIEGVARLLPGVLGHPESSRRESYSEWAGKDGFDHPHFTRPAEYRGRKVPEVLASGDHGQIEAWRREQARKRTRTETE